MIYLTHTELIRVGERVVGGELLERDHGLLQSAAARPQASAFGEDAYPALEDKAAALLHSVVRNHALVDGNKRLGLGALIVFLGINGRQLLLSNDDAYALIMDVAGGRLDDVPSIAARLRAATGTY